MPMQGNPTVGSILSYQPLPESSHTALPVPWDSYRWRRPLTPTGNCALHYTRKEYGVKDDFIEFRSTDTDMGWSATNLDHLSLTINLVWLMSSQLLAYITSACFPQSAVRGTMAVYSRDTRITVLCILASFGYEGRHCGNNLNSSGHRLSNSSAPHQTAAGVPIT